MVMGAIRKSFINIIFSALIFSMLIILASGCSSDDNHRQQTCQPDTRSPETHPEKIAGFARFVGNLLHQSSPNAGNKLLSGRHVIY